MLKKYIVIMLSLLMLELAGCGTPTKVQSNTSESKTTNVIVYESRSNKYNRFKRNHVFSYGRAQCEI